MKGGLFQCGEARLFHVQEQKLYINRSAITPKTTSFLLRKAIQAEYF